MPIDTIALPTPENEEFHTLLERCNDASSYFNWLHKKQSKLMQSMHAYPLLNKKNSKIITLLKKELAEMDRIINPIREIGYEMFANPKFDYKERDPLKVLFATQHYTLFILYRVKLVEEDYKSCLDNYRKIVNENRYRYTKNISILSLAIAIVSIAIAFFTLSSSFEIRNNFHFHLF
ncbi:MAG: hypothetical protein JJU37_05670 [Balneolaceae bacterium]|nr:hypothetical protein [Balneolaceae bacterium]